jgi:alanyl aminopeptidase
VRFLWLLALVACSAPDRGKSMRAGPPMREPPAPGLRLPGGVTPLHYDLTLDVDPDQETFSGEVRIKLRLDRAADHVWLHAEQLAITSVRDASGELRVLPSKGDQMIAIGLGRRVSGEHELHIRYTGRTTGEQEGLFRQYVGGRWYLFSQGEAVFARRIAPCFDEPRFKTPWRVTLVVPRALAAFANGSDEKTVVEVARKRITFAETPPMPSYSLTIAVGSFDVVDAGTVGKQRVPVRVLVRAGAGKQVGVVAAKLPAIVDAMEAYFGEPLPLRKLDLVAIPEFFGAQENPGLITFDEEMLVGKDSKQRIAYFTHVAAHEIAHQWFGNTVTPAWWDDLWLSESFASFAGDKVSRALGAFEEWPLFEVRERRDALEADAGAGAAPLRRTIETNADPDNAFDAIAYQKGEAVLATFEGLVGETAFRDVLRGFVAAHRDRSATTADFIRELAAATKPEVGAAFEQYTTLAGAPIVDLALRCDTKPALVATARDRRLVPLCVAHPNAKTPACALVGATTELPLGAACPVWLDANPARGYYTVHWQDRAATQWLGKLSPEARIIIGDDLAAAFHRGELPATAALRELRTLLAGDISSQVAALALAKEIDALVDEAARDAWSAWLVPRIPKLKAKSDSLTRTVVATLSTMLLPEHRYTAEQGKKLRELVDKQIDADSLADEQLVAAVAAHDGAELFERVRDKALATTSLAMKDRWLRLLGAFPAPFAERTAALVVERAELPFDLVWGGLAGYFQRPATRLAGWRALRRHLATFFKRGTGSGPEMIDAAAALCDVTSRGEVAKAFEPHVAAIASGRARLERALAAIDRCVARKARIGDLAAAIASSR